MDNIKKPVILVIIDGFGIGEKTENNAIAKAKTPNLDRIFKENPFTTLSASGEDVGLPCGQMGNSEVGHTNIGAGRTVYQDLTRISKDIEDGDFFKNSEINAVLEHTKSSGGRLHIGGLLSNGGVHSHISHFYALLKLVKELNLHDIAVHAWLDGRDVSPSSGLSYVKECEEKLNSLGIGKIETICGRYYSMDRDNRWERTSAAYNAMANALGKKFSTAENFIEESYKNGITDEFIIPGVKNGYNGISNNDAFICFNFRPDRARQITRAFCDKEIQNLNSKRVYPLDYLCLTEYDPLITGVKVAYKPATIRNTLGECVAKNGLKQLRIAETEKYAHVTFFFNGGKEEAFDGEERILIPSPKVATYNLKPEMSAYEITSKATEEMRKSKPRLIILNYANCDMVGHTGILEATVKAVETVDECVGKLIECVKSLGYVGVITADHGNAEKMRDQNGLPFTSHTTNPVPFAIVNYQCRLNSGGKLSDIAPTILDIMNIPCPNEMSGVSLILQ